MKSKFVEHSADAPEHTGLYHFSPSIYVGNVVVTVPPITLQEVLLGITVAEVIQTYENAVIASFHLQISIRRHSIAGESPSLR